MISYGIWVIQLSFNNTIINATLAEDYDDGIYDWFICTMTIFIYDFLIQ